MPATHSFRRPGLFVLSLSSSILIAVTCVSFAAAPKPEAVSQALPSPLQLAHHYGKLPLSFEPNQGQSDPQVKFLSRGRGYALFLTDRAAVLSLSKPSHEGCALKGSEAIDPKAKDPHSDAIKMELANANPTARVEGTNQLPGTANYFIGDATNWHTNIPTYAKVQYTGIYPGIDLIYYGNQHQLEYDFVVSPGASPKPIQLHFAGAETLRLAHNGDLEILAKNGQIAFHKPVLYQEKGGQRQPVAGSFKLLTNHRVAFAIGEYDPTRSLIIDPTLAYSTYLGGSNTDQGVAIAADSAGDAYVAGATGSTNFPVTGSAFEKYPTGFSGGLSFVTKFNPAGTALLYSTYFEASVLAIAVDSGGNAYFTGESDSSGVAATPGAYQSVNDGTAAFVAKLNPAGSALVYLTYLGGTGSGGIVAGSAIAVDSAGEAFVTGSARTANFPVTAGAFQPTNNAANGPYTVAGGNAFVTKLNATGSGLVYSTFLGGADTTASAIAIDAAGNAYVTGSTISYDNFGYVAIFPTTAGSFDPGEKLGSDDTAGYLVSEVYGSFVTKLNPTGTALVYSTYLGDSYIDQTGAGGDSPVGSSGSTAAIAVDDAGNAYLTGSTENTSFPVTPGAFQTSNGSQSGNSNGFVTKLNASGSALVYSTYLGGSIGPSNGYLDVANGIAVDGSGNAYVVGQASSTNFPITTNAFQKVNNGANAGAANAFFTEINPTGSALVYSTYLGGSNKSDEGNQDGANAVALDRAGGVYLTGQAGSYNFPVTSAAFQPNVSPGNYTQTAFVAKFEMTGSGTTKTATTTTITSSANPQTAGLNVTFTVNVKASSGTGIPTGTVATTVNGQPGPTLTLSNGTATYSTNALPVGTNAIVAAYGGDSNYSASTGSITENISVAVATVATPIFSPAVGTYSTAQTLTITDATAGATIYYTTNGTTPTTASTRYTGPFTVSATETIEAFAVATGDTNSAVATARYTIETLAATPVFSVASGTYAATQTVTVSDATAGAVIYCTTNGATPTPSSTAYTGPITVSSSETLECIAVAPGYTNSPVATANYTIETPAATPVFSIAAGTYPATQTVAITDATAGAAIYYTTNGTTPTTASTKYTAAITVAATETLEAIAVATGYNNSAVTIARYTIGTPAANPAFSVPAGAYPTTQTVTITDATAGATIYYTTNGTTPTTTSAKYTAAITVAASETLEAIAVASGYIPSAIETATYTIGAQAATPTFTPGAGTYATAQKVTIASATVGAAIYYTTNETTPTASSTKYTGPITVAASQYIKAIAVAPGYTQSAVATSEYLIDLPAATPVFSPAAGTYTSAQAVKISDATAGATVYYTTNETTPNASSTKYTGPITVAASQYIKAVAVAPGHTQSAVATNEYLIDLPAATPVISPAAGTYTSAKTVEIADATAGATIYYTTNETTPTTSSTKYTGAITVAVSQYIKAIAVASGHPQSAVATSEFLIEPPVATPTFSPIPGTYTAAQSVKIADSTAGATIYYTTNGTTPTTASTKYTAAITVSASETIQAIAVATGHSQSATASAKFTIQ